MTQADIIEVTVSSILIYLMMIPITFGYLSRKDENEPESDRYHGSVLLVFSFFWPMTFVSLILVNLCSFLYSMGRTFGKP